MSKSPAFQFYPKEYLASEKVALMDLEHEGPYLRALCYCWLNGSIPSDPKQLARLIGKGCSEDAARVVQGCFDLVQLDPLRMTHKRLDSERDKQRLWAEKSANGGKKSGQIRKEKAESKGGSRVVEPKVNTAFTSPSAFASPKEPPIPPKSTEVENFKTFAEPIKRIFSFNPTSVSDERKLWDWCQDFAAKGTTAEEVETMAKRAAVLWDGKPFTAKGILNNWDSLKNAKPPKPKHQTQGALN